MSMVSWETTIIDGICYEKVGIVRCNGSQFSKQSHKLPIYCFVKVLSLSKYFVTFCVSCRRFYRLTNHEFRMNDKDDHIRMYMGFVYEHVPSLPANNHRRHVICRQNMRVVPFMWFHKPLHFLPQDDWYFHSKCNDTNKFYILNNLIYFI